MASKSSADHYGTVAMAIHWATAIAIVALLVVGFVAADTADEATKIQLLRVHTVAGVSVLALTLFRIGWWLFVDRLPRAVQGLPRWQGMSGLAGPPPFLRGSSIVLAASGHRHDAAIRGRQRALWRCDRTARFHGICAARRARPWRPSAGAPRRASRRRGALPPVRRAATIR